MGWWRSERGVIGDNPADLMDHFLTDLEDAYMSRAKRLPTQGELADLVEFSTAGALRAQCGKADEPFSRQLSYHDGYPRAAPRGQQGMLGICAAEGAGELRNVDPGTGEHFERGEAEKLLEDERKELEEGKDVP